RSSFRLLSRRRARPDLLKGRRRRGSSRGFASASHGGKYGATAIRCPETRRPFGSRSDLN
ncbi:hypothetical protein PENTCL1PPCAC_28394, partial [Pristionchus entomophagus]